MITIPNYDSEKYTVLLQKAWEDLYGAHKLKPVDETAANNGQYTFSNLQHYFSYIQDLVILDKNYIMMPIDEDSITINANTRTMTVPPVFNTCGGVQSDNYAEIITFVIDRYFDYQDLANVNIMVQWRNEASKVEGFSIIDLIDLETYGADNKIRFGWPLTKDMTASAGTLTFAVRFFHSGINPETKAEELSYVLNTLASSIQIKPTLNINLDNPDLKVNRNDYETFLNFVINSSNPSYNIPTSVEFINGLPKTARLENDTLTLEAWAKTKDRRVLTYEWYRKIPDTYGPYQPKDNVFPERRPQFNLYTLTEGTTSDYVKYEGVWPPTKMVSVDGGDPIEQPYEVSDFFIYEPVVKLESDALRFDVITSMELYNPKDSEGNFCWPATCPNGLTVWTKDTSVTPNAYKVYQEEWPTTMTEDGLYLYINMAKLIFKPEGGTDILGEYFVRAYNRIVENNETVNEVFADSPTIGSCVIAAPEEIEFTTNLGGGQFLPADGDVKLTVAISKDDNNPNLSYELRDYSKPVKIGDVQYEYTIVDTIQNTSDNEVTFSVAQNGTYQIHVSSNLNRYQEEGLSNPCTLFNAPIALEGTMYVGETEITEETTIGKYEEVNGTPMLTIDATSITDEYELRVDAITNEDDENIDDYSVGVVSYVWRRADNDTIGDPVVITKEMTNEHPSSGGESDIDKIDNNKLTIISTQPSSNVVTYYCDIYNKITINNGDEQITETAGPTTYIFVIK